LEDPVTNFFNGCNLAHDRVRKLYIALTGDEVQKATFWPKFKASASLRHRIIHDGALAGKTEAEDSCKAADDLLAHLDL
jgi:hypothetical protein